MGSKKFSFAGARCKEMMLLALNEGAVVSYKDGFYKIKSPVSLSKVLLINEGGETIIAPISELKPAEKPRFIELENNEKSPNRGIEANCFMDIPDQTWEKIKSREACIKKLLEEKPGIKRVQEAAILLGVSTRQVYNLLKNYKQSGCNLSGLVLKKRLGGKDRGRLLPATETIIRDTLEEVYCNKQKLKASIVIEEIQRRCALAKVAIPSPMTVRNRLKKIPQRSLIITREGSKAAQKLNPIVGESPQTGYPLQLVQIDHTKVDLIIVDEHYREPIGRPYLTLAIDLYSRCITGFYLSLEPPSATSVGLCLLHAIFDKSEWLSVRNIEGEWPIYGKPDLIYVDNAKEFHSEALIRGCEFHGIKIEYRPIGAPHYGGVVERIIGTLMQLVHQIPGTTFSNIQEKGGYAAEKQAVLTLKELEKWLGVAIVNYYHQKPHSHLCMPPIEQYRLGILGSEGEKGRGYPPQIINPKAFLIDFLPIERRMLRRCGFVLDHIAYFSHALTPWIYQRGAQQFTIRRDPRDLSRIYVLDVKSNSYLEIPYRSLARPSITLWEHRAALKHLRDYGKKQVDEGLIFKAIEEMRSLVKEACHKSKKARKNQARVALTEVERGHFAQVQASIIAEENLPAGPIKPFKEIERW